MDCFVIWWCSVCINSVLVRTGVDGVNISIWSPLLLNVINKPLTPVMFPHPIVFLTLFDDCPNEKKTLDDSYFPHCQSIWLHAHSTGWYNMFKRLQNTHYANLLIYTVIKSFLATRTHRIYMPFFSFKTWNCVSWLLYQK